MNYPSLNSTVPTEANATSVAECQCPSLVQVSLVIPLYNEREGISRLLESLVDLEANLENKYAFEFVLVDDGSRDGTAELLTSAVADRPNYRVLRHSNNRGIAAAIHTGLLHAEYEIVASIDSDGSYEATLLMDMLPRFEDHVDLLTASPYHPEGRVENVPGWRLLLSQCASKLYQCAMRPKLYCYTSCFRLYRRSQFQEIQPEFNGFVGIAELIWKADAHGLTIVEHPAVLRTRLTGRSKMKIFRSSMQHLRLINRIVIERFWRHRRIA